MFFIRILCFFPLLLAAFEPKIVTPYPVLGVSEISLSEKGRSFSVWYPVALEREGTASLNGWDHFRVATNALPAPSRTKRAVIVLSHGYMGTPNNLSWLIRGLVHRGFIVIAMTHNDRVEGKVHINHWMRARDIHRMIDQFATSSFADFANLNKIGIAGFSLGGTTAVWIAGGRATKLDSLMPGPEYASPENYAQIDEALPTLDKENMARNWRDARVKAAFVMAPAWAWLFDEGSLKNISIPMYFIAAAADSELVTQNNAGYFAKNIPKSIFQTISGKAGHYIFISALNDSDRKKVDPSQKISFLFEDEAPVDRRWIQMQLIGEAVRFFNDAFDQ